MILWDNHFFNDDTKLGLALANDIHCGIQIPYSGFP
jgi:hypothetical protein